MYVEPSVGPLTPLKFPPVFFISRFTEDLVGRLVVRFPLATEGFVGVWVLLGFVVEVDFAAVVLC